MRVPNLGAMNPLKRLGLSVLLAALIGGRATAALSPATAAIAGNASAAQSAPAESGASADTAAFRARIADVLREVSTARELEPLRPVEPWLQSREDLMAYVHRQFEREDAARRLRNEGQVLQLFGLLPRGYSLPDSLKAIYREQIGGVYDYHSDRLLLADWLAPEMQEPVMAHELVHALQDQRYEIGVRLDSLIALDNDDATQSFLALAEGDATAVMLAFAAGALGLPPGSFEQAAALLPEMLAQMSGEAPRLAAAPPVIQKSLLFPYVQGTAFVLALRRTIPWSDFARVYERPPASSSEILHPERYLAGERNAARIGWSEDLSRSCCPGRYENTLGEWNLRLTLARSLPDSAAAAAADGWVSDRYLLLGTDSARSMVFLATMWRDEAEADEFFDAAAGVFLSDAPPGGARVERGTHDEIGEFVSRTTPQTTNWVSRRGNEVIVGLGDEPRDSRDAAVRAQADAWRAVRRPAGR